VADLVVCGRLVVVLLPVTMLRSGIRAMEEAEAAIECHRPAGSFRPHFIHTATVRGVHGEILQAWSHFHG